MSAALGVILAVSFTAAALATSSSRMQPATYDDATFHLIVDSYDTSSGFATGTIVAAVDCGQVVIWGHTFDGPIVAYRLPGPVRGGALAGWSGRLVDAEGRPLAAVWIHPWWYGVTCGGDLAHPPSD